MPPIWNDPAPKHRKAEQDQCVEKPILRQLGGDCGVGVEVAGLGVELWHAELFRVEAGLFLCIIQSREHAVTLATDVSKRESIQDKARAYLAVMVGLLVASPGLAQVVALERHVRDSMKEGEERNILGSCSRRRHRSFHDPISRRNREPHPLFQPPWKDMCLR